MYLIAVFAFVAVSTAAFVATLTVNTPCVDGVTLNVHDVPEPNTLDAVAFVTVIPPDVMPVTDSLKVAVTVIGDTVVTLAAVVAIVTVGATPSHQICQW